MESRGFTELEPMARAVALHLPTGEAAGQSEALPAVPGGPFIEGNSSTTGGSLYLVRWISVLGDLAQP